MIMFDIILAIILLIVIYNAVEFLKKCVRGDDDNE
jgi:hypothetical protein